MRKNINLFIILLSFILFPCLVNAECSKQQIYELNKLVDNIQIKYEHTGDNLFKVTLYNIPEHITGTSIVGMFNDVENPKNSVSGFIGGYNYKIFYIANENNECGVEVLKTVDLNIPIYNIHSKKDICKDKKYDEFKYCNEILDKAISEEEFNNKLVEYEKSINVETNKQNASNWTQFLKDKFVIVCVSVVLTLIIVISIVIYNKKKNKL